MQFSDGAANRPLPYAGAVVDTVVPEASSRIASPVLATTRSPDATSAVSSGAVAVCMSTCSAYHQIQFQL